MRHRKSRMASINIPKGRRKMSTSQWSNWLWRLWLPPIARVAELDAFPNVARHKIGDVSGKEGKSVFIAGIGGKS